MGISVLERKIEGGGKRGKRKINDFVSNISTVTGEWLYKIRGQKRENGSTSTKTPRRKYSQQIGDFRGARAKAGRKWEIGRTAGCRSRRVIRRRRWETLRGFDLQRKRWCRALFCGFCGVAGGRNGRCAYVAEQAKKRGEKTGAEKQAIFAVQK